MYDYLVVNHDFERALAELRSIITAERCRTGLIDRTWIDDLTK